MTLTEQYKKELAKKYQLYTIRDFLRSVNPDKNKLCKYLITFTDNSTIEVVMTDRQRSGIVKSKMYNVIKSICGQGHVKPFHTPGELPTYFRPGLLKLVFQNESNQQYKSLNGYGDLSEAETAADYYKQGNFKNSGSRIVDAFICQDIEPVFK